MMIQYIAFAWINKPLVCFMLIADGTIAAFALLRVIKDHEYLVVDFIFPSHKHLPHTKTYYLFSFIKLD